MASTPRKRSRPLRILLSNDDGVHAPGLRALYEAFSALGRVAVVAPLEERSTTGHSLTLHKPLRMIPISKDFYGVSGSPADCIYLGSRKVFGDLPDLVISGINRGANMGQDVYYSGTVSAAREACILGVPAMAVSLDVNFRKVPPENKLHYASAARIAVQVARRMPKLDLPRHTLLNLNVPDLPLASIRGIQCARQGFRFYSGGILQRKDHRGKDYYWVGGTYRGYRRERGSDCDWLEQGFAALTPLRLDSTDYDCLAELQSENWGRQSGVHDENASGVAHAPRAHSGAGLLARSLCHDEALLQRAQGLVGLAEAGGRRGGSGLAQAHGAPGDRSLQGPGHPGVRKGPAAQVEAGRTDHRPGLASQKSQDHFPFWITPGRTS
jgi:5'-nucleotidase